MCYSGVCSFEDGGDNAGECTAPSGFRERYGVSPCIVGGCYEDPDDERWAEEHEDEIEKARYAYWEDLGADNLERDEISNELTEAFRRHGRAQRTRRCR